MRAIDLTNQRFGRLVAIGRAENDRGCGRARWTCVCDCGGTKAVQAGDLRAGLIRSCGCLKKETASVTARKNGWRHGHNPAGNPSATYNSFQAMSQRCLNPNASKFPTYGGAGVTICDRWQGEEGFSNFLQDMGERPPGTTLGRFGDMGPYEKSNCAWQTPAEQVANRRPDRKYRPKKQVAQIAA